MNQMNIGNAVRTAGTVVRGVIGAAIGGGVGLFVGVLLGLILGATVSAPVGIVTGACVAGFGFLSGIVVAVVGGPRVARSISARMRDV